MSQVENTVVAKRPLGAWIRQRPVLALVLLVYLFEWLILIPDALQSNGLLPFHIPDIVGILAGWAPGLAAAIVAGALGGWASVKKLIRRYLIRRVGLQWYLIALFGTAAFILGGIALSRLLGASVPSLPITQTPWTTSLLAFVVMVALGFVANLEDVAWRGVALPLLQARHGALVASLIIGLLEGLTHLPYFFVAGDFRQQVGIWFMLFSVAIVIVLTWMYNSTGGSLLIVVLYHATQNAWSNLLDTTPRPGPNDLAPFIMTVVLMWVVAITVTILTGPERLSRRPASEMPTV